MRNLLLVRPTIVAVLLALLFSAAPSGAITLPSAASARFVQPVSLTEVTALNFGDVSTSISAGQTIIINTAGAISGTGSAFALGGSAVGDITVAGSAIPAQTINILVDNSISNNGVTVSAFTCNYGGAGEVACDSLISSLAAPGPTGTTLLLGATATFAGGHADGTIASPTFEVVVIYD